MTARSSLTAGSYETWVLADDVRELIQRSRRLQRILKAKHDKASDMRSAEVLEAEAEMALECIDGLSAEDAICLVRLATKGPMTTAHYNLEYMHPYFKQLVDISRVSPSEDRITLTDAAKEALKMQPELVNSIAPMSM